jgi:hypothetical protein
MASASFDLRVDARLKLVGDIWDSIAEEANVNPEVLPLSRSNARLAGAVRCAAGAPRRDSAFASPDGGVALHRTQFVTHHPLLERQLVLPLQFTM